MSHLEFLVGMDWKEESSRVVRRLVQTHSHIPQVWIYAARFELERKIDKREKLDNPEVYFDKLENSRRLLLEGIRHHSDSREIYREYFCLELHYIEKLNSKEENESKSSSGDSNIEIKEGKIARIVLKQALEDIPEDPKFETELLALIYHFPIAKVRTKMIDYYLEIRGERTTTWDIVARLQLLDKVSDDGRNLVDKIEQCCQVYERAVEKIPTSEMFDKYLTTLFELSRSVATDQAEKAFMTVKVLEAFSLAEKFDTLDENHRQIYKKIVEQDEGDSSSD